MRRLFSFLLMIPAAGLNSGSVLTITVAGATSAAAQTGAESVRPGDVPPTSGEALDSALQLLSQWDQSPEEADRSTIIAELEKVIDRARAESESDPRRHYLMGRWHALTGRQGDAVTALRKYVDTRDGRHDWLAHRVLADLFVEQFPHLARASYEQANTLKSDEPTVLYGLAKCAEKLGGASEALGLARRLVEVAPTARYRAFLARILFVQRQFDDAEREAQGALELALEAERTNPAMPSAAADLDGYYKLLLDMHRARLNEDPSDADRYLTTARLIRARAENGRRLASLEAVSLIKRGMERLADNAPLTLREQFAIALVEAGRTVEARSTLLDIQRRDPANAVAAEWLAKLDASAPETSK